MPPAKSKRPVAIYQFLAPRKIPVLTEAKQNAKIRGEVPRGTPLLVTGIRLNWYQVQAGKISGWVQGSNLPEIAESAGMYARRPPPSVIRPSARAYLKARIQRSLADDPDRLTGTLARVEQTLEAAARPLNLLLHRAALVQMGSSQARQDLRDLIGMMAVADPTPPRPQDLTIRLGRPADGPRKLPALDSLGLDRAGFRPPAVPCLFFGEALARILGGIVSTVLAGARKPDDRVVQDELFQAFIILDRSVVRLTAIERAMHSGEDLKSPEARFRFLDTLEIALQAAGAKDAHAGDAQFPNLNQARPTSGDWGGVNPDDRPGGSVPWPGAGGDFCRWQRGEQIGDVLECGYCNYRYSVTAIVNETYPALGARACPGAFIVIEGSGFGAERSVWESGGVERDHVVFPARIGEGTIHVRDDASYREWSDTRIVVRMPDDAGSGQIALNLMCRDVSGPAGPGCLPNVRVYDANWIQRDDAPDPARRPRFLLNLSDAAQLDNLSVTPAAEGERTTCASLGLHWHHRYVRSVIVRGPTLPATGELRTYEGFEDGALRMDSIMIPALPTGPHTFTLEGTTVCGTPITNTIRLQILPAPLRLTVPDRVALGETLACEIALPCAAPHDSELQIRVTEARSPAGKLDPMSATVSLVAGETRSSRNFIGQSVGRVLITAREPVGLFELPRRYRPASAVVAITPLIDAVSPSSVHIGQEITITGLGYDDGGRPCRVLFFPPGGAATSLLAEIPAEADGDAHIRVRVSDQARGQEQIKVQVKVGDRLSNLSEEISIRRPAITAVTEDHPGGPWRITGMGLGTSALAVEFRAKDERGEWMTLETAMATPVPGGFLLSGIPSCLAGPGIKIDFPSLGLTAVPPRLAGPFEPVTMHWHDGTPTEPQATSILGDRTLALFVEGHGGGRDTPNATITYRRGDPPSPSHYNDWRVTVTGEANMAMNEGVAGLACNVALFWSFARVGTYEGLDRPGVYTIQAREGLSGKRLGALLRMQVTQVIPSSTGSGAARVQLWVSPDRTLLMAVGAAAGSSEFAWHVWDLAAGDAITGEDFPKGTELSRNETDRELVIATVEPDEDGKLQVVVRAGGDPSPIPLGDRIV